MKKSNHLLCSQYIKYPLSISYNINSSIKILFFFLLLIIVPYYSNLYLFIIFFISFYLLFMNYLKHQISINIKDRFSIYIILLYTIIFFYTYNHMNIIFSYTAINIPNKITLSFIKKIYFKVNFYIYYISYQIPNFFFG